MARLSLFLPPFAGDYSGAASTLFGLDCLVILLDAGCCTRNYVEYDEPRWARRRKTTFSAGLRTLEVVLGDEARVVDQVVEAARELKPSCVALLGTPVPAITGMDLPGLACEVEASCGVPSVGVETCGFETYEQGVSRALEVLARRFALGDRDDACPIGTGGCPRVAVWGISPHDFLSEGDADAVLGWLDDVGLDVVFATGASWSLDDLHRAAQADASVVVAWSGLAAACALHAGADVPYVVGRPWCPEDARALADAVRAGLACGEGARLWDGGPSASAEHTPCEGVAPVLLLGEQVAMASLRPHVARALAEADRPRPVVVGSFFAMDDGLLAPGDLHFPDEAALITWARGHPSFAWVGDPLFARVPGFAEAPHAELPHEAVSSTLFAGQAAQLAGEVALRAVRSALF